MYDMQQIFENEAKFEETSENPLSWRWKRITRLWDRWLYEIIHWGKFIRDIDIYLYHLLN